MGRPTPYIGAPSEVNNFLTLTTPTAPPMRGGPLAEMSNFLRYGRGTYMPLYKPLTLYILNRGKSLYTTVTLYS